MRYIYTFPNSVCNDLEMVSKCLINMFTGNHASGSRIIRGLGVLYESPILSQLLDLISPPKINTSEPRFESYDPWDMAN